MENIIFKRLSMYIGVFLFFPVLLNSQNYYNLNKDLRSAYTNILNLNLEKGQKILDSLKYAEPENMAVYHIENYIDFFRIFINEDTREFSKLEENKDFRLKKLRTIDKKSPYYKFSIAEVYLQWALSRLKFEEYFTALREIDKAYDLLEENRERFPEFVLNNKSLSIIHAVIGTLPDTYKTLLKFFSNLDGTISQGSDEIGNVLSFSRKNNFFFKDEAYTIAIFMAFHLENDPVKAWKIVKEANLDVSNSPLACFVVANMAQKTGRNDYAIQILEKKPDSHSKLPFYYLDYMLGKSYLYKMDTRAINYLNYFVNNFNGKNYIKDAYLKIAWYEYVKNHSEEGYWKNIEKCASKGEKIVDEDKSAYKEAMKAILPDSILLKARILFDGAYYLKAYSYLVRNENKFVNKGDKSLEFYYRMGRVLEELNSFEALKYFEKTIELGKDNKLYFACNAAMQTGVIYEKMKKYKEAENFYKMCLGMNPEEYKNSIHQKAKAGLIRIKSK